MRFVPKVSTRRWLLIQLAALEIGAGWMLYRSRDLLVFLGLSAFVAVLAATVYWIDYLIRHDVTNFGVCIAIGVAAGAAGFWFVGNKALAIAFGVAALLFAGNILRKLLRPISVEQQEDFAKAYRARAEAERKSLSPISRDVVSLLFFVVVATGTWLFNGFTDTSFLRIILLLALFDACQLIFHILTRQKSTIVAPASTESAANQGGGA